MKTAFSSLLLAVALTGYSAAPNTADYVVHEWGTFTSLQGADGMQLTWRPEIGADLPKFVYLDNGQKSVGAGYPLMSIFAKKFRAARQRMETPVLYFYSPKPLEVDVEVRFPQGTVTEWFPRVSHAGPAVAPKVFNLPGLKHTDSFIRWDNVMIRPDLKHDELQLKHDGKQSHYYPAREARANPLTITTGKGGKKLTEMETLLFYRGIGTFEAPLKATINSDESLVQLRNTGLKPISRAVFLEVRDGRARFQTIDGVKKTADVKWKPGKNLRPLEQVSKELATELVSLLVSEGLYEAEAKAMVNNWRESWFEENGVRVLYPLAREWTDGVLPLNLNPRPKEIVRVMIGRAELIPPSSQWTLTQAIVKYANPATRAEAVKMARDLHLGRFLLPAIESTGGPHAAKAFRLAANNLAAVLRQPKGQIANLFSANAGF